VYRPEETAGQYDRSVLNARGLASFTAVNHWLILALDISKLRQRQNLHEAATSVDRCQLGARERPTARRPQPHGTPPCDRAISDQHAGIGTYATGTMAASTRLCCTGRGEPPVEHVDAAWLICGRRAGKSFDLALAAVFLAAFREWEKPAARACRR
jgi:hypothetical protein